MSAKRTLTEMEGMEVNTPENHMCLQKSGKFRLNQRIVLNCEEMVSALNESSRSDVDLEVHNLSITPGTMDDCKETKPAMMVCLEQKTSSSTKRLKGTSKKLWTPKRKNVYKSIKKLNF